MRNDHDINPRIIHNNYKYICTQHRKKLKVLVTQSYPALYNPMDCSSPGSSVRGILQTRILEWDTGVSILFSRGSSQTRNQTCVSCNAGRPILYHLTHQRSPENIGMGSYALIQGIFPTKRSNLFLLHYRQILYHMSCEAPQFIRQMITATNGEIDNNTKIVGNFNTILTWIDRSSGQNINKEAEALNYTLVQMNIIDIYMTFHPKSVEFNFT